MATSLIPSWKKPVETGSATVVADYASVGSCPWRKVGQMVYGYCDVTFTTVPGNSVPFVTGLPPAAGNTFFVLAGQNNEAVRAEITQYGDIRFNYGARPTGARNYTGGFAYATA